MKFIIPQGLFPSGLIRCSDNPGEGRLAGVSSSFDRGGEGGTEGYHPVGNGKGEPSSQVWDFLVCTAIASSLARVGL